MLLATHLQHFAILSSTDIGHASSTGWSMGNNIHLSKPTLIKRAELHILKFNGVANCYTFAYNWTWKIYILVSLQMEHEQELGALQVQEPNKFNFEGLK